MLPCFGMLRTVRVFEHGRIGYVEKKHQENRSFIAKTPQIPQKSGLCLRRWSQETHGQRWDHSQDIDRYCDSGIFKRGFLWVSVSKMWGESSVWRRLLVRQNGVWTGWYQEDTSGGMPFQREVGCHGERYQNWTDFFQLYVAKQTIHSIAGWH